MLFGQENIVHKQLESETSASSTANKPLDLGETIGSLRLAIGNLKNLVPIPDNPIERNKVNNTLRKTDQAITGILAFFGARQQEIVVKKRSDDYQAYLKEDKAVWECGDTPDEAVGKILRNHPDKIRLQIRHEE